MQFIIHMNLLVACDFVGVSHENALPGLYLHICPMCHSKAMSPIPNTKQFSYKIVSINFNTYGMDISSCDTNL